MDEWGMDGWVDGWVTDGWMDGWGVNGWMGVDGRMCKFMDR